MAGFPKKVKVTVTEENDLESWRKRRESVLFGGDLTHYYFRRHDVDALDGMIVLMVEESPGSSSASPNYSNELREGESLL